MSYFKSNVNPSKRGGMYGVFLGLARLLLGFPSGFDLGESLGATLPALGKPRPSLLFYLDCHNIVSKVTAVLPYWANRLVP